MGQPVVHFEIAGSDAARLQKFYGDLFGWKIDASNPMAYGLVDTDSGGGIGGGITSQGAAGVTVYAAVPDVQQYLDRAVSMGAKVVTPVTEVPGMVVFATFSDPAGNVFGLVKEEPPPAA